MKKNNKSFLLSFFLIITLVITYANDNLSNQNIHYYSIENIKLGEIDTLKINDPNILNIKKIQWKDFISFLHKKNIEVQTINNTESLKNETWFTVQTFDLINETFDSIPIQIDLKNNRDTVFFISLNFYVSQNKDVKNENFKELKPIEDVSFKLSELWTDHVYRTRLIISLIIFFTILIIIIIIKKVKKKHQNNIRIIKKNITYMYYVSELEKLKKINYIEEKKYKLFYTTLSNLFREYLEFRFNIQALESTSDDLILKLKKDKITQNWMLEFINESDLVKFAKYMPNKNKENLFLDLLEDFIRVNKDKPPINRND